MTDNIQTVPVALPLHASRESVIRESAVQAERRTVGVAISAAARKASQWIRDHVLATICLAYLSVILLAALAPQLIARYDPYATSPQSKLLAPSAQHWFGTDQLGRDLFARVTFGARTTILASLLALAIAAISGLIIGIISGYRGGLTDVLTMRGIDVLLAIPGLLLAITIVTAIGFGTIPVAIAIGIGIMPSFARTTRAQVLRVRERSYVEAARVCGASNARIILTHILPNSFGPVAVLTLLDFGVVIMSVATLSFLGFGAAPPAAEWGSLINDGRSYLITSPWVPLLPGLVVVATVLAVTIVANTLKEGLER
ncbi:ABC transporter permease [Bifidobacterium margollesii]|uniref:ABC transporter permease n=1 Tax=Bifidobacterium margollesii TaxID=2020964 RepID=A0A2N5JBU6_9BIFI|nr:ABC transporter permease [Bifidobacterium margollesii]PLS31690.1 ABC transporter permease [Bifidobacterium margollesii]